MNFIGGAIHIIRQGVSGLCLDPHDLAIAKYVARREKDVVFTRELARRGIVKEKQLLELLEKTAVASDARERIRGFIEQDFKKYPIYEITRSDLRREKSRS